jgi:hypothetical protein
MMLYLIPEVVEGSLVLVALSVKKDGAQLSEDKSKQPGNFEISSLLKRL